MRDEDLILLLGSIAIVGLLAIAIIALEAGDIVSELLAPIPSVAGPLGAAVAIIVFLYLVGKGLSLVLQ